MMVSNRMSFFGVLLWQWQHSLVFIAAELGAWLGVEHLDMQHLKLPAIPAQVIGSALGIFAAFRANAAYQRWWEGRQLWGRLVNTSRMWASQCRAYIADQALAERLVRRHVLYVHVLRCQLRDDDPLKDDHVRRALTALNASADDEDRYRGQTSLCHCLVDDQLRAAAAAGLDERRLQSLDQTLMAFLDVQGGCERIKRTPMPRGYGFFVERLILFFAVLFPLGVVEDVGWAVVPLNIVVCMGFTLISETGRVLEDPFNHFYNSLPITSIAVNIERNITQRLGDAPLPPVVAVDSNGILW
jgi:putative membrane protein